jgi:predicted RNA binding protein YcfA (HicA-like mRNA interferase family)
MFAGLPSLRWHEKKGFDQAVGRDGGSHDWYQNPTTRISQPIPRHNEIQEYLAKHILKMLADEKSV